MARWRDQGVVVPARLARFAVGDWPGDNPAGAWGAAARAWLADNPGHVLPLAADPLEVRERVVAWRLALLVGAPLGTSPADVVSGAWRGLHVAGDAP